MVDEEKFDINKDGAVDILDVSKMVDFIKLFDKDGDGTVRINDMREWIKSLDFDNNNKIDIEDIKVFINTLYGV